MGGTNLNGKKAQLELSSVRAVSYHNHLIMQNSAKKNIATIRSAGADQFAQTQTALLRIS